MRISVFAMGYIGTASAGCLVNDGHDFVGVNLLHTKMDLINSGHTPIIEAEPDEIIRAVLHRSAWQWGTIGISLPLYWSNAPQIAQVNKR